MAESIEKPTVEEITQELRDVALQVHAAEERRDERDIVLAARQGVDQLARRYRLLYDSAPAGEQMKLDRTLGRRVVDLKRLASLLPKIGQAELVESTPDRQVSGPSVVGERRITGVSWNAGTHARPAGAGSRVGSDVDAWCGKCGELTTHSIVALLGNDPKTVLCQTCNSRHSYRTTPARKRASDGEGAQAPVAMSPRESAESAKRAEAQRALATEIANATNVQLFDSKARYRVGDIIAHPDFGRGKVETVLRSSILVRFPVGGLKSLMLY